MTGHGSLKFSIDFLRALIDEIYILLPLNASWRRHHIIFSAGQEIRCVLHFFSNNSIIFIRKRTFRSRNRDLLMKRCFFVSATLVRYRVTSQLLGDRTGEVPPIIWTLVPRGTPCVSNTRHIACTSGMTSWKTESAEEITERPD